MGYGIFAMVLVHVAITVGDTWLGIVIMLALGVACCTWKAAGPMIGLAPLVGMPCYALYRIILEGAWGSLVFIAVLFGGVYGLEVWQRRSKREGK